MAATLAPNFTMESRTSTETERRYLLANDSVAPSESASMITNLGADGDVTPRARSPAPSLRTADKQLDERSRIPAGPAHTRHASLVEQSMDSEPYRGFPSKAAYMAALREWAESKKYTEPQHTALKGFYGDTTMEEYASRPAQDLGIKRRWRARKEAKQAKEEAKISARRNTVV